MDPAVRALVETIARLRKDVRSQARGSQAAFRSVELSDGPVRYYDASGNVVAQTGVAPDGSVVIRQNPAAVAAPPTPTTPDLDPIPDGILVKYDGTFVDGVWSETIARVEIHRMPDANSLDADTNTQIGTVVSREGGVFPWRAVEADGPQFFRLQAVNTAGVESALSDVVSATALSGLDQAIEDSQAMAAEVAAIADLIEKINSTRHFIFE